MPDKSGDEATEPANLTANFQLLRHIVSGQKTAQKQKRIRVNQGYSQNRACWVVGDLTFKHHLILMRCRFVIKRKATIFRPKILPR